MNNEVDMRCVIEKIFNVCEGVLTYNSMDNEMDFINLYSLD